MSNQIRVLKRPSQAALWNSLSIYNPPKVEPPEKGIIKLATGKRSFNELKDTYPNSGFLVMCEWSMDCWLAATPEILNSNFIYQDDLCIREYNSMDQLQEIWDKSVFSEVNDGTRYSKKCYILDHKVTESYECYYDPSYPMIQYGAATPLGMNVLKFPNRFVRDEYILQLNDRYQRISLSSLNKLSHDSIPYDTAIVISDGSYNNGSCASSFWYIDSKTISQHTGGFVPTSVSSGALIAEVNGVREALFYAMFKRKTNIICYFDNLGIVNLLSTKKHDTIREVRDYKQYLEYLDSKGVSIEFRDIHPKTGDYEDLNKALGYLHSRCDRSCTDMTLLNTERYVQVACTDNHKGKSYKQFKKNLQAKGGN